MAKISKLKQRKKDGSTKQTRKHYHCNLYILISLDHLRHHLVDTN